MADPAVQGRVTLSTDTFTPTRNLLNVGWREKYRDALKKICSAPKLSPDLAVILKTSQELDIRDTNPVAQHPAVAKAYEEPQHPEPGDPFKAQGQFHPNQDIPRQQALGSLATTTASTLFKAPWLRNTLNWGGPVASGLYAGATNPPEVAQRDTAGIAAHLKNVQLQQQAAAAHEAARSGKPEDVQAYIKAERDYRNDLRNQAATEYSTHLSPSVDSRSAGLTNALWNAETGAQVAASLPPAEATAKGALLRRAMLPYGISSAVGAGAQALAGRSPGEIGETFIRSALPETAAQLAYRRVAPSLVGARFAALRGAGPAALAASIPTAAFNINDYANNMDESERKAMLRQESEEAMDRGVAGKIYQPLRAAGKFITGDLTGAANMTIAQQPESMEAAKMDAANRNKYVRPPIEAGDNPRDPTFSDPRNRMYTPNDTKRWMSNVLDDMPTVPSKYVSQLMSGAFQNPRTVAHVSNIDGAMARVLHDAKREGVTIPPERMPELKRRIQLAELQKPENQEALKALEANIQKLTGTQLTEKGANDLGALVANIGPAGAQTAIEQGMSGRLDGGIWMQKDLGWFEPKGRFAPRDTSQNDKMRSQMSEEAKARAIYRAAHPDGVRRVG